MEGAEFSQALLSNPTLAQLQQAFQHELLGGPLVDALANSQVREHARGLILEMPLEQVALKLIIALENDTLRPHAEKCLCERAGRSAQDDTAIHRLIALREWNGDKLGQRIDLLRIKLDKMTIQAPKGIAGGPTQPVRQSIR